MLHVTIILCDTLLVASVGDDQKWHGVCTDALTGEHRKLEWTHDQMAATLALGVGGEDSFDDETTQKLYKIAESGMLEWPNNVRPIP